MATIEVRKYDDFHDCETCGSSYAEGAEIFIDDVVVENLKPLAACFDGQSYTDDEIWIAVLSKLGHKAFVS